jgi:hypothetical protein
MYLLTRGEPESRAAYSVDDEYIQTLFCINANTFLILKLQQILEIVPLCL